MGFEDCAHNRRGIDDFPALASQYGVQGIPTLLVFDGGSVVDQVVGVATLADEYQISSK